MKKKTIIMIACFMAAILIILCLNVFVSREAIRSRTYAEIESRGYAASEISSVRLDHSYLRRVLGYNEWRIAVEFEEVPDVFFWFTYKGGRILFQGVSSEPMMDKKAIIEYSEKYKNGTLPVK